MSPLFAQSEVLATFADLRRDLLHEGGPRISTMRNYRFAIVQYPPSEELAVRREVQRLSGELVSYGWSVLSIDLSKLMLDRIRALGPEWTERMIAMERQLSAIEPSRGLEHLKAKLAPLIEGPQGLAADCARIIGEHIDRHPDAVDRTLALVGRAGGMYPFYRTSGLLRHLDGRTRNVPVVLLYPGTKRGDTGLSFMGLLQADNDYRPRIYPEGRAR